MPPPPQPGDPAASTPADDGLVSFLRLKLAGEALPAAAGTHFHDCDIYAADPATLTEGYLPVPARKGEGGSWFFFTHVRPKSSSDSRKKRTVGGGAGTWHSERAPRAVLDGEGNCIGHSQYFSYKRKTGKSCSERTDWYMVEFTEGQEGNHERIHGGEPVLVLCKIYKAHSGLRSSSSSSRSVRKRKATEEHADATSAPVKAKRRLFDSSAPTLLPASQEQRVTMVTSGLESQGEVAKFEPEDCHVELGDTLNQLIFWASQSNASDYLKFSPNREASQEQLSSRFTMATSRLESQGNAATFEPDACHGEIGDTLDGLSFWASHSNMDSTPDNLRFSPNPEVSTSQSKTNTTIPSFFMSETEMSRGNIGGTLDHLIYSPEPEPLQDVIGSSSEYLKFTPEPEAAQNMKSTEPPSLLMSETEMTFQDEISGSPDYLRFCSEPEASQGMIDSPSNYLKFSPEPEAAQNKTNTRFWPESEATQKIGVTADYLKFLPRTEASQKASTTPPSQLMFEPEVQALQGESETATLNWGNQMTGNCTAPAPSHCYGMSGLDDSPSDYLKFNPEPEAAQNKTNTTPPSLFMSEPETTQGKIGGTSDYLRFWPEPEASQGTIDIPSDYLKFNPEPEAAQNNTNTTLPSLFMSEPETTQGKIGGTPDYLRFWPEPEATQKIGGTSDYLKFLLGTEALRKANATSPSQLMFEPEIQTLQGESETATRTFNWGQMTVNCATPVPSHCYGMTDLDDSYWRGNNKVSCCRGVGWFFGAPPTVCSPARFPISPSICGGPTLWSC